MCRDSLVGWQLSAFERGQGRPFLMDFSSCSSWCCCVYVACSPSLSSSETFQVDVVEAWQLVPPQEEPASQGNGKKGTCSGGQPTMLVRSTATGCSSCC